MQGQQPAKTITMPILNIFAEELFIQLQEKLSWSIKNLLTIQKQATFRRKKLENNSGEWKRDKKENNAFFNVHWKKQNRKKKFK